MKKKKILEWVAITFSRDLPDPGDEPGYPALQADSLLSEPPGKPSLIFIISFLLLNLGFVCLSFSFTCQVRLFP